MKADVRRRSGRNDDGRVKIWVAVFACSISSAVKLYLCRDYSEEGFLQAWRQHVCDWGEPSLVYSDRGTQLVSAAGGLDPKDKEDIVDWGKDSGVNIFHKIGKPFPNGQFQNHKLFPENVT